MSRTKVQKPAEIKVAPNLRSRNIVETICSYGITILSFIVFGFIAVMTFLETSVIDPANFGGEHILFNKDDIAMNIFLVGSFFLIAYGLSKFGNVFLKVNDFFLIAGLVVYTVTFGFIWIFMTQSIPSADSGTVYNTAVQVVNGDFSSFHSSNNDFYNNISYYQIYPFQLGFVFISEIVYSIFGTETAMPMQVFNVLALAAMYVGLLLISKKLFNKKAVTFITTFMLAGCIQPIFFCSFTYGNIIGLSSAVWAIYFIICFMQSKEKKAPLMLIPAALLITFSVIAKYNNMIWLLAIAIGMVIYVIREKKWIHLASTALIVLIAVGGFNLVIISYESRSGVELADGVSQTLYLRDGISESNMAPGWYNDKGKSDYIESNCNNEVANEKAKADIDARLEKFSNDTPYRNKFFREKILSQWNEPSYECLWVSQVKTHYNGEVENDTLLYSIYNGNWNKFLYDYFDYFATISFILFTVAMVSLIKRKCSAEMIILLTGLMGGFLYHLLFEGKSQYILTYFIIVVFFASYGLYVCVRPRSFKESKSKIGTLFNKGIEKVESLTR